MPQRPCGSDASACVSAIWTRCRVSTTRDRAGGDDQGSGGVTPGAGSAPLLERFADPSAKAAAAAHGHNQPDPRILIKQGVTVRTGLPVHVAGSGGTDHLDAPLLWPDLAFGG